LLRSQPPIIAHAVGVTVTVHIRRHRHRQHGRGRGQGLQQHSQLGPDQPSIKPSRAPERAVAAVAARMMVEMADNQFVSVENSKHGILTDMNEVVYNFIVTGYRIFIEGIEFGAYYTQDPDTYADWDAGMQRLNEELRDGK